jgi:hypothetical protein
MRAIYTHPDYELTVALRQDFQVICGPSNLKPDVTLTMPADVADRFWRGDYNLTVGLAKGHVKVKGQIGKILRLIPLTKPLFPMYRVKIAEKDRAVGPEDDHRGCPAPSDADRRPVSRLRPADAARVPRTVARPWRSRSAASQSSGRSVMNYSPTAQSQKRRPQQVGRHFWLWDQSSSVCAV